LRASTIIKMAERNRDEMFSTYRFQQPSWDDSWLGIQVDMCLESFPAMAEVRQRHNGKTDCDFLRFEAYEAHPSFPFRIEHVNVFLCPNQDATSAGGAKIARFRTLGCPVTDNGSGGNFTLLSDEEQDFYFSCHEHQILHHEFIPEDGVKLKITSLPPLYPRMGRPFKPTQSYTGTFYVDWGFGDIYNTLFHPCIGEVLAKAHSKSRWRCVEGKDIVSVYLKMPGRVEPHSNMEVFIFIDEVTLQEVYIFKNFENWSHAWAGAALFDPQHPEIHYEIMQVAGQGAVFLMNWLMESRPPRVPDTLKSILDMSECQRC